MPKVKFMGMEFDYIDQIEDPKRPELGFMIVSGQFQKHMHFMQGPFEVVDDDGEVAEPKPYGKVLRMLAKHVEGTGMERIEIVWTPDMNYELPDEEQFDDSNLA